MRILLDTHIWLWSLSDPDRVVRRAKQAVENPDSELWISPISVWEALLLLEKNRINFLRDAPSLIQEAVRNLPAREATLTHEIAIESRRLLKFHEDPADRFLVATARVMGLTLVTADQQIIKSGACAVLPNG